MKKVKITQIDDSMILGEDVLDKNGTPIIHKGARLTIENIARILQYGIAEVEILDPDEFSALSVENRYHELFKRYGVTNLKDLRKAIREKEDLRFQKTRGNSVMNALKEEIIQQKYQTFGLKEELDLL